MSQDLEQRWHVVSERTGERLTADSPTEDLGAWLADIRDTEGRIREAKRAVTRELIRRMDKNAEWTTRIPGYKLSAPSPKPVTQYDGVGLHVGLSDMVADGTISFEAMDAAVQEIVEYRVKAAGVNALRKLGGKVAELIDRCSETVEKERYVKVERA